MARTLADLRSNPAPARRPERSATICLRPDLVAEVQALTEVIANSPVGAPTDEDTSKRPRRAGEGEPPEVADARTRLAEVLVEMADEEGELRLRANWSDGEWRRWCSEHPARDKESRDGEYDAVVASGFCDADALVETLGSFAHAWDGDPLAAEDWAQVFEPNIGQADKKSLAGLVVSMYEARVDFPSWRSNLSATLNRFNGSASPEPTQSATSGSTAGSRRGSSAGTTKTAAKSA